MASYTMQLRTLVEQASQRQTDLSIRDRIAVGRHQVFDFDYPIFDEDYRETFETHFIRHFYMREIGYEVEGLFKFYLETWLNIHMPYFNQLFESEKLKFDPLLNSYMESSEVTTGEKQQDDVRDISGDSALKEQSDSTQSQQGKSASESTSKQNQKSNQDEDNFTRNLESNNPDSRLTITSNDGEGVIEYASQINEVNEQNSKTSDTDTTQTQSGKGTSEQDAQALANRVADTVIKQQDKLNSYIKEQADKKNIREGKIGVQSYSKLLQEYRSSFIRIEQELFEEMNELFMLVY